jgi:hypothetical protein
MFLPGSRIRSVADPHHFNVDPELAFHFYADPNHPTFHFHADLDPAPQQSMVMRICDLWSSDPPGLHVCLHASTFVSVHGPL